MDSSRPPGRAPETVAAQLTGATATGRRPLSAAVTEVALDEGKSVVVKKGERDRAVQAEAAGLRWLAASRTVRVPGVRGVTGPWLVTDQVPTGRPTARAALRFGRQLAALHAAGAPAFGSPPPDGPRDAFIGLAPMRNEPRDDWPRWYAEERVLPYVRRAVDAGTLRPREAELLERAAVRLPELAGPAEEPARLHGDLWNGNVLWDEDGGVWLIDPAAHGGHRETDLAMLRLFGCAHLDHIMAGYEETAPLAAGWQERVTLHQLFPVLVHAVLFGRSYALQAVEIGAALVRA